MSDISVGAMDTAIEHRECRKCSLLRNVFIPIVVFVESNEDIEGQCVLLCACVCVCESVCA